MGNLKRLCGREGEGGGTDGGKGRGREGGRVGR